MLRHEGLSLKHRLGGVYKSYFIGLLVFFFSFLASALVSSSLFPAFDSSASELVVSNRATGYFVTVTTPDVASLSVDATPTGQTAVSDASVINVVTNAPGGYKLYLSANDNTLKSSDTSITQSFSPTSSGESISLNSWGFSLDPTVISSNTWSPVPKVDLPEVNGGNTTESYMVNNGAALISQASSANYPDGTNTNIYYGVNSDTTMPAGAYSTIVTYTAFAEGIPATSTMQGFTIAECNNMDTDSQQELIDIRNNKVYKIVKARDGNCWMADNLSIYNTTLDSTTTNLEQGTTFTLPNTSNWNTNDYTQPLIHVATNTGYEGEVYYNWCSAVALTGSDCATTAQQQYNICPKGWTLPINGTATTDKSYAKLMNAYGVTTGEQLLAQTSLGFSKYYGTWNYTSTAEVYQGSYGFFLSATTINASSTYRLTYYDSITKPTDNSNKGEGISVRCVFENRTMSNLTYMQDMTTQICDNTAEGTKKTLLDKRGTGNAGGTAGGYGVLKAKDGNCWMTDNLNLYNKTISAADSDFQTGSFTIPASSNWNTNDYTNARVHIGANSGYVGVNYYNWCAATAQVSCSEVSIANTSICPNGFRLPLNGNDFLKFFSTYSITTGAQLLAQTELGFTKYYGHWSYYYPAEFNQGGIGFFWTATPYTEQLAQSSDYGSGSLGLYNGNDKGNGETVRCVSR